MSYTNNDTWFGAQFPLASKSFTLISKTHPEEKLKAENFLF